MNRKKIQLSFILLDCEGSALKKFLDRENIPNHSLQVGGKKNYPKAILQIRKLLKSLSSTVVHCHMREANMLGLTAAKGAGIKKRIYTRHFSTSNHVYHPKSVKIDRLVNSMSTDIVAISEVVKKTLIEKEHVAAEKISLIHHGFDLTRFGHNDVAQLQGLRKKYHLDSGQLVIGVISRYLHLKGYQYIIPALEKLADDYPNAQFVFANASGPYKTEVQQLIKKHIPNNTVEIIFERDLFHLYQLFDIYIHAPIDPQLEAFGQTYIEALSAGIPMICTISGIAHEVIVDGENALVVDYKNSEQIYNAMIELLSNEDLRDNLISNGKRSVGKFELAHFISKLEQLYA